MVGGTSFPSRIAGVGRRRPVSSRWLAVVRIAVGRCAPMRPRSTRRETVPTEKASDATITSVRTMNFGCVIWIMYGQPSIIVPTRLGSRALVVMLVQDDVSDADELEPMDALVLDVMDSERGLALLPPGPGPAWVGGDISRPDVDVILTSSGLERTNVNVRKNKYTMEM